MAGKREDQITNVRITSAFQARKKHLIRRQIINLEGDRLVPEPGSSSSPGLLRKSQVEDYMLDDTTGAPVELATNKAPEHMLVPSLADSNEPASSLMMPDYGDEWVSDSSTTDDTLPQDSNRSGSITHRSDLLDWSVVDAKMEADRNFKKELEKLAEDSQSSWVLKHLLRKAYPEIQENPRSKAKVPESKIGVVRLEDFLGRKFIFPFDRCKTWEVSVQVPLIK